MHALTETKECWEKRGGRGCNSKYRQIYTRKFVDVWGTGMVFWGVVWAQEYREGRLGMALKVLASVNVAKVLGSVRIGVGRRRSAMWCSTLECIEVCCSAVYCFGVDCSALQCTVES